MPLQEDNNLVAYTVDGLYAGWASNTDNQGVGKARLILGNDAVLVLVDSSGTDLWRSEIVSRPRDHPLGAIAKTARNLFALSI